MLLKNENQIFRVLQTQGDKSLVIDCIKKTMPKWVDAAALSVYTECSEAALHELTHYTDSREDYIGMLYGAESDTRIFQMSKHSLKRAMEKACKATGIKVIRVHDLRHSHVSLLIDMGFSALAIAERVGHESIDITYRYAHLFPTRQTEMADKLDLERLEKGA